MLMNRERTSKFLQELGVEAAVLSGGPNFNYAAGWGSDAHLWGGGPFAIVPSDEKEEVTLIIANHELPFVWRDADFKPNLRTVGREVEPVVPSSDYKPLPAEARYLAAYEEGRKKNYEDRMEALADTLSDLGLSNAYLGFDDVRVAQQLERMNAFTGTYEDVVQTFRYIRSVKSPHEIEIIRKANEANLRGIEDVVIALREGAPFNEALIQHDIRLAKEDAMRSVPSRISGVGRMGMALFQRQDYDGYQMQPGDLVRFDFEGTYERYWTDLGRTCSVGEPSAKAKQYYEGMLAGREAAMEAMRPGARASEVCRIAVEAIQKNGCPEYVTGKGLCMFHVIGLELYEQWCWYPHGDFTLEEDMTINFESPFFEMGFGGMQLEDTYLIKKDGPVDLSGTLTRDIMII